jgi:acetyl-CoA carboxylase biotin carboxyl carrier protein
MVGTFYTSPSPDSDVFVTVGAVIDEDAVVCIVEAMKLMNEVKAECAGTIAEICVKNAQPVEYGQVLFRVRPA